MDVIKQKKKGGLFAKNLRKRYRTENQKKTFCWVFFAKAVGFEFLSDMKII